MLTSSNLKLLFLSILSSLIPLTTCTAGTLNFAGINDSLKSKYTSIDFSVGGIGSEGGIFWSQTLNLSSENYVVMNIDDQTITCKEQIRGIYYNSKRGNAVRPLDQQTLEDFRELDTLYDNVKLEQGLYTTCYSGTETITSNYLEGGIYGQLIFTGSYTTGALTAGTTYDLDYNKLGNNDSQSLAYLNNTPAPIGYIYDNGGGGIGFVGGILSGDDTIENNHNTVLGAINNGSGVNDIFDIYTDPDNLSNNTITWTANGDSGTIQENKDILQNMRTSVGETLMKIGLGGNALASKGALSDEIRKQIIKNIGYEEGEQNQTQKTTIVASDNLNVVDVINKANKRAYQLCQNNYEEIGSIKFNDLEPIQCVKKRDNNNNDIVTIDNSVISPSGERKTIIVKEGTNLLLSGGISKDYLDIFIQKGNLYIQSSTTSLKEFDKGGQLSSDSNGGSPVTSGMNLNGNFVVNGLIAGYSGTNSDGTAIGSFPHKLYIHGRIASLNSIKEPAKPRKLMIKRRFKDWYSDWGEYAQYINFENGFNWRCKEAIGKGTDGVNCSNITDKYRANPVIFLPKKYDSEILK